MSNDLKIGSTVSGMYKVQILEDGVVVKDNPWEKNLILNTFLDYLCGGGNTITTLTSVHVVGTGTNIPAATDVGLGTEVRRTATYLTGAGNCGRTEAVNGTLVFRRTYDHELEVAAQNYTEHGLSYTMDTGSNLVTRALFSSGTVTVGIGQQLRVIYDITVVVNPHTLTPCTVGGTGWPVLPATNCDGNMVLGWSEALVGNMNTDGVPAGDVGFLSFRYNGNINSMFASPQTTGYSPSYGSGAGVDLQQLIWYVADTYITGTFTRTTRPNGYASATSFSSTAITGFAWSPNYNNVLHFKYNQNQTKDDSHRLRYPSVTITWSAT